MVTANPSAAQTNKSPGGRIVPFGRYLLLQRVSVGGMAEIFKAVPEGAKRLDNILAIKRILPSIAEDEEFIGMFVDEARIAGQLTHPNICRIYELGKVGETNYIAMQFLYGRDLLRVINRFKRVGRRTPPPLTAYVGARACAGLHYAHTKHDAQGRPLQIIHRDVSPQNIIVGYSGQVKVIDFGVARAASQSQKTQAGVVKGKFGYMSPEIIKGQEIDARSDVFAMGVCLWEGLTGKRLFHGDSDFHTLELVREAKVVPPSSQGADIPPELDAAVMKALTANPDDRFADASQLQEALDDVLARRYRGFGESDVGLIMRQAFSQEIDLERQRLSQFETMMAHGLLVRGAELEPLGGRSIADDSTLRGPALGGRSRPPVADESPTLSPGSSQLQEPEWQVPSFETIQEDATTIFFSANELEQLEETMDPGHGVEEVNPLDVELEDEAVPAPHAADVLMPGAHSALDTDPAMSPWTDLSAFRVMPPESGPISQQLPLRHPSDSPRATRHLTSRGQPDVRSSALPRGTRLAPMLVIAILTGIVTYAATRTMRPDTGTLLINASGARGAIVRVDGVMRGNPPLRISELPAGIHNLEVEAPGYETVRKRVVVTRGQTTPLTLLLEQAAGRPARPPSPQSQATRYNIQPVEAERAEPPSEAERRASRPESDPDRTKPARRADEKPKPRSTGRGTRSTSSPAANQQPAELMISTLPWSRVFLDGNDTGLDTPVRSLPVTPGRHVLGLRTSDGTVHQVPVSVAAGQKLRIIRRF